MMRRPSRAALPASPVDAPYEPRRDAEVVIDTTDVSSSKAAEQVLTFLSEAGYLPADKPTTAT